MFFKCHANLKCCTVKQLFNVSEEETSLSCVVTSSLHPAAAVSLLSKYSFPLFALMQKMVVFSNVCTAESSRCIGCVPAATFLPWQQVSKEVWVGREGDKSQVKLCGSFPFACGKFSCWKWRMGVLCRATHGGIIGDPESTLAPAWWGGW